MGIEPTYQLVTGTTGLKPGGPTRCPTAPTKLRSVRTQLIPRPINSKFTAVVSSTRTRRLSSGIVSVQILPHAGRGNRYRRNVHRLHPVRRENDPHPQGPLDSRR